MEYSILVRPDYFEEHEKTLAKEAGKVCKQKVPSDVKLALYRQANYRHRLLRDKGREVTVKHKREVSTANSSETQTEPLPIISTLPKTLQSKGEQFLQFLQSIPDFRINEKGEIAYGDRVVEGSRIIDIVHDFVRDRPSKTPAKGWQVVAEVLKEHNVPKEFVGNPSRWQYIQTLESSPFNRNETSTPRNLTKTLSDLADIRRRLSFQSGSGIGNVLRTLKWKTH